MRIVCLSDTHGMHDKIDVPDGDILIHAGDFCNTGRARDIERFNTWLGKLPHPHKIVVAGNHDRLFEEEPDRARSLVTNAIYLQDSETTVGDLRIWGTPWQPYFNGWAFNLRTEAERAAKWALIPSGVDILVTHGPPFGVMDRTIDGVRAGCVALGVALTRVDPRLHVFGHIHEGYGVNDWRAYDSLGRVSVNAAICDASYRPVNRPIVVDL